MTECKHGRLTSFRATDDGELVGILECAFCGLKFVPLDIEQERDAKRYRWLRAENNSNAELCPFVSGRDLDTGIDVAMLEEEG